MRRLRLHLVRGSRRQRENARAWLLRHPRLARFLDRMGCLHVDERTLARGVALGLFVGLTPTVGIQTMLMLFGAAILRANFVAAFMVSFVSNPFTMAPLYYGFNQLGAAVIEWLPLKMRLTDLTELEAEIVRETTALLTGSLCVAVPAAVLGYFGFLYLWRRFDLHLPHHHD